MAEKPADIDTPVVAGFLPWHEPILERLLGLKNKKRLPHAILLDTDSSEDGASLLWYLSSLLLCSNNNGITICGACHSCLLMAANTYPDLIQVTLQYDEKTKKINKTIKIEQIRKLTHEVYLTNNFNNLKIVLIYPADKMTIESANALLKTVEEPAADTLVLLLTDNKGKIPVTIRSRCQNWQISLPEPDVAMNWLGDQLTELSEARLYLDYARGDPQLALILHAMEYAATVDQFKRQFAQYLGGEIDVARLCSGISRLPAPLVRRLISMVISAYCYQYSGLTKQAEGQGKVNKPLAQQVIPLLHDARRKLLVEENNLDLQLQLEDVLISLKQIIKQGSR